MTISSWIRRTVPGFQSPPPPGSASPLEAAAGAAVPARVARGTPRVERRSDPADGLGPAGHPRCRQQRRGRQRGRLSSFAGAAGRTEPAAGDGQQRIDVFQTGVGSDRADHPRVRGRRRPGGQSACAGFGHAAIHPVRGRIRRFRPVALERRRGGLGQLSPGGWGRFLGRDRQRSGMYDDRPDGRRRGAGRTDGGPPFVQLLRLGHPDRTERQRPAGRRAVAVRLGHRPGSFVSGTATAIGDLRRRCRRRRSPCAAWIHGGRPT